MNKRIFRILIVFIFLLIPILVNAQDTQKQGSSFSPVWSEGKNANGARESVVSQKLIETKETKGDFKMTTLEIILLITTIICGFFWFEQRNKHNNLLRSFTAQNAVRFAETLSVLGVEEETAMNTACTLFEISEKEFGYNLLLANDIQLKAEEYLKNFKA